MRNYATTAAGLALIVLLSACGGGGGDDQLTGFGEGIAPGDGTTPGGGSGGFGGLVVSGTVKVPDSISVDADVNDPNASYTSNDTAAVAQLISNPVSLGGYVNTPSTGETGRSQGPGDISDFFSLSLLAGQQITLAIAKPDSGDLDLYLWDAAGATVIDASVGGPGVGTERLTVPADATYLIEVRADLGASGYNLVVGLGGLNAPTVASARRAVKLSDDFIPGQLVLRSASPAAKTFAANRSLNSSSVTVPMSVIAGSDEQLVQLRLAPVATQALQQAGGSHADHMASATLRDKYLTLMAMKQLQHSGDYAYVEPNFLLQPFAVPNDPYFPFQWHYPLINLPAAWDLTMGESSVTVAVIDTGVLLSHPDMQGQLVSGYDFISDTLNAGDGDGLDSDPDDPGDGGGDTPSSFHGTHVAGTIAAATNNATGGAGVAGGVKIMPLRVLGQLGGSSYDVRQAIRYAAGLSNDSATTASPPVDVINLSLGGGGFSQADQDVFTEVRAAGVIVVAAAGNNGSFETVYPAGYDGVVAVSAVASIKQITGYSSRGSAVDVAAPGGDTSIDRNGDGYIDGVLSSGGSDGQGSIEFVYPFYQGTSMAAPHVAGVAALMKSVHPMLTPAEFDALLINGDLTEDLGIAGRDDLYGYGLIDAQKAVIAAISAIGAPPVISPALSVSPGSISFGSALTDADVTLRNIGSGALEVQSTTIIPAAPWLAVTPVDIDADGIGVYRFTVDRSALAEGSYATVVRFISSENTVAVPVIVQKRNGVLGGNVGATYVLLVDDDAGEIIDQFDGVTIDGQMSYSFSDVSPGNYSVIAGTDVDNDFVICDSAEACGGYPSLDNWSSVPVTGNVSGLDFFVSFAGTLSQGTSGAAGLPRSQQAKETD